MMNFSAQHVFHVSFLCVSFQSFNSVVEDVVKVIQFNSKSFIVYPQSTAIKFCLCLEACS